MRTAFAALSALLLYAAPVVAQGTPEQQLKTDPNVATSQQPQPAPQGTRAPEATPTDTGNEDLYQLVQQIWSSPASLQGEPDTAAGASTEPAPAAASAEGCGATSAELAARPPLSGTPCPPGSVAPTKAP